MPDKSMTIDEIIDQLEDGMTIGIGGWGSRRKPMALVRALVRSSLKNLTIVSYGGMDVGMLCASAQLKKLVFGFVSLDSVPLDPHFRKARQAGLIEVMELDEGLLQWGLKAASMNLSFLPALVGLGSDVERLNLELKRVRSPYGQKESLLAMPALKLDVALLHVNLADKKGNPFVFGADPYFDAWFARASSKTFITCEKLEDHVCLNDIFQARTMLAERFLIDGVALAPLGAHPTLCPPDYGMDRDHISHYASTKDWSDYRQSFIDNKNHDEYITAIGGAAHVRELAQTSL